MNLFTFIGKHLGYRKASGISDSYSAQIISYTDDHGNNVDYATSIVPGTTITGNFEVERDHDSFSFIPTAGTAYQTSGTVHMTASSSNPVYFSVKASDAMGSYTIKILTDDHGEDVGHSTLISEGVPMAGTVEVPGERDYFRFVPVSGNSYQIKLTQGPLFGDIFLDCYNSVCEVWTRNSQEQGTTSLTAL